MNCQSTLAVIMGRDNGPSSSHKEMSNAAGLIQVLGSKQFGLEIDLERTYCPLGGNVCHSLPGERLFKAEAFAGS